MRFIVNLDNKKVVDNLLICLILKFYDFRPAGLGVIDFINYLSGSDCVLCSSETWYFLTLLTVESS
jgi:hypothetical protein